MADLKDRRILITGGSLGIGKAAAKLLIESGAKVAITGRNRQRLESAAEELGALAIAGDVSKLADVERTFSTFLDEFGGLDTLVNNAAFGRSRLLLDVTPEDMRQVWETNVLGATMVAQQAARIFVEQEYGDIINIASTASLRGYKGGSAYSSSKFALRSLSECWRAELRPYNVRVISIHPSEVTTAFGSPDGIERPEQPNRLRSHEVAHCIKAAIEMDDRGFIPDLSIYATNPF
jgi:3-oxoacyl-[acyl-carrier protein] reductase